MTRSKLAERRMARKEARGEIVRFSNFQVALLIDVAERELKKDPNNIDWREMLQKFIRMANFRKMEYGEVVITPPKVWGRDYV